jgi:preprotein translocase subunit YajC
MNDSTSFIILLAPIAVVYYFLLLRPQQQQLKQHKAMQDGVRRGDTVVTAGGIVGKVAKVKDDGEILVEIADNVQVRVMKATLTEVRSKGTDAKNDN